MLRYLNVKLTFEYCKKDMYYPKVQATDPLLAASDEPKEQILAASSQVEL